MAKQKDRKNNGIADSDLPSSGPPATAAANIAKAAQRVRAELEAMTGLFRKSLAHARTVGRLLSEVRPNFRHGTWATWLLEEFAMTSRTASNYVTIHKRWDEIVTAAEAAGIQPANYGIAGAVKLLAKPRKAVAETAGEAAAGEEDGGEGGGEDDPEEATSAELEFAELEKRVNAIVRHPDAAYLDRLRTLRDKLDRAIRKAEAVRLAA